MVGASDDDIASGGGIGAALVFPGRKHVTENRGDHDASHEQHERMRHPQMSHERDGIMAVGCRGLQGCGPLEGLRFMLFGRALLAFLVLPGTVGFLVPALLVPRLTTRTIHVIGLVPFISGVAVLLWCVRDFYVAGKGTLAPWDPPRHLVRVGLYRYSRNPMYVGVLLILVGWATGFRTPALAIYAVVVAILFHLRVLVHEEPWLARTFPGEWPAYRSRVPRWLIRVS